MTSRAPVYALDLSPTAVHGRNEAPSAAGVIIPDVHTPYYYDWKDF